MRSRLSALLLLSWYGGLLAGAVGCSRPALVAPAEVAAVTEEARPVVVRAKAPVEHTEPAREAPAADPEAFRFPNDPGGALLARVLSPGEPHATPADRITGPRPLPPPDLEPRLPLPENRGPLVPRLPVQRKSPSPRPFLEESLGSPRRDPALPSDPTLPAGERTFIPSGDVNQPIPLPVLAQPVTDRAPLGDATGEASTAAALFAPLPRRTTPAPFLRLTLPDPYEHRRPLEAEPPTEPSTPAAARPQTPAR
jgi:hypothetical protein